MPFSKKVLPFSAMLLISLNCQAANNLISASPALTADKVSGVGALGRIEPRSRVIRISHNVGPEGSQVLELLFDEGEQVSKNSVLAILADRPQREAEYRAAKAAGSELTAKLASEQINLAFNEKEYHRYQKLSEQSSASLSLKDEKKRNYDQSKVLIKQLEAEIERNQADQAIAKAILGNSFIRAPISGTVLKIHTRPGEKIDDDGLLEMADLSELDVVAEVYESDFPRIRTGQKATVQLDGFSIIYEAEVRELGFMVKKNDLNDTDPLADRDNRTIEVRLSLDAQSATDLKHQIYRQVKIRFQP
ncbi:HlyD family efflux transporter periplasmic adaptor subunit [Methylicorpusculum sp.]|uniref:HlyD family efflux transporter periplasmic adaptor subunit n=1 Tax=Methylicorpusculum sp. TaxID=2713644 RepID=UPI002730126C|nr:HlyD family efflux transporter periplasmic adaptor subunit [Methylicorpusculum sp.]MDP2178626.1 HlyD family efflux transporter periplasmic adaptor subunit [Methylicorpusculum sp.]MDP3527775.1 HlyD family efflux transporter periplasmic adaptor subunit [Methylicorpusculum sp.]